MAASSAAFFGLRPARRKPTGRLSGSCQYHSLLRDRRCIGHNGFCILEFTGAFRVAFSSGIFSEASLATGLGASRSAFFAACLALMRGLGDAYRSSNFIYRKLLRYRGQHQPAASAFSWNCRGFRARGLCQLAAFEFNFSLLSPSGGPVGAQFP
jgi:hypothetical protein